VGEIERPREAQPSQLVIDPVGVTREYELHEHVDDGGRSTRVLLGKRRSLGRDRDGNVPERFVHELPQSLLMGWVDVGVEEADCNTLDRTAPEYRELLSRVLLIEREELRAVGEQALGH